MYLYFERPTKYRVVKEVLVANGVPRTSISELTFFGHLLSIRVFAEHRGFVASALERVVGARLLHSFDPLDPAFRTMISGKDADRSDEAYSHKLAVMGERAVVARDRIVAECPIPSKRRDMSGYLCDIALTLVAAARALTTKAAVTYSTPVLEEMLRDAERGSGAAGSVNQDEVGRLRVLLERRKAAERVGAATLLKTPAAGMAAGQN
jgi:hypothetical protein